jgi:hypothetical protein
VEIGDDAPYLAGRRLENHFQFGETPVETNTYIALGADTGYFRGSHGQLYEEPNTGLPPTAGLGYPQVSGSLGFKAWAPGRSAEKGVQ